MAVQEAPGQQNGLLKVQESGQLLPEHVPALQLSPKQQLPDVPPQLCPEPLQELGCTHLEPLQRNPGQQTTPPKLQAEFKPPQELASPVPLLPQNNPVQQLSPKPSQVWPLALHNRSQRPEKQIVPEQQGVVESQNKTPQEVTVVEVDVVGVVPQKPPLHGSPPQQLCPTSDEQVCPEVLHVSVAHFPALQKFEQHWDAAVHFELKAPHPSGLVVVVVVVGVAHLPPLQKFEQHWDAAVHVELKAPHTGGLVVVVVVVGVAHLPALQKFEQHWDAAVHVELKAPHTGGLVAPQYLKPSTASLQVLPSQHSSVFTHDTPEAVHAKLSLQAPLSSSVHFELPLVPSSTLGGLQVNR